jgi:site-specific recombinase XerC
MDKKLTIFKAKGRQPGHYIPDLRQKLINHRPFDWIEQRGIVLVLLLLDGLTWQECCSLTLDQLRLDLGIVLVDDQHSKPIARDTIKAIEQYLEIRLQKGPCQVLLTQYAGKPLAANYINLSFHLRWFGRRAGIHHNLSISSVRRSMVPQLLP